MGSVTMKSVVVTSSLLFLGIAVLFAFADGHGHSYSLDPAAQCVNASDSTECERRIGVCRGLHRSNRGNSSHRAQYMVRAQTCATELGITLPNFNSQSDEQQEGAGEGQGQGHGHGNGHSQWKTWARENPEDKRRLMTCVHRGVGIFNADGTVNRTRMTEKINQMFTTVTEAALQQELVNRAQNCPQEVNQSRGEYFRCVFEGCVTS